MTVDRRFILAAGAAVVVVGAVGWYGLRDSPLATVQVPGLSEANAQDRDLSGLQQPPELGERALGEEDAPVTIIEYASATCPH